MTTEIQTIFIEGEVMWAKVQTPVKNLNDEMEFSVDVEVTQDQIDKLYTKGMSKKRKAKEHNGKMFLTIKRPVESRAGKVLPPPRIMDKALNDFDGLLGNGTKAKVKIDLIPYSNKFGEGVVVRLVAIQVLDLVEYKTTSNVTDGFDMVGEEDAFDDVLPF